MVGSERMHGVDCYVLLLCLETRNICIQTMHTSGGHPSTLLEFLLASLCIQIRWLFVPSNSFLPLLVNPVTPARRTWPSDSD